MDIKALLTSVLREIRPKDKHIEKETASMLRVINAQLKKDKLKAIATTGGSIAKNTYLVDDHDCDIFVQFDQKYRDEDISALLGTSLRKIFPKCITLHGSRDYYQLRDALHFEIVPVLRIRKTAEAVNITDCSPLHVTWVRRFPKLADEIRLTRAFCKANGIYGAESYIKGFSGHVIDIITIHYGGFLKLLEAARKWKEKTIIDHHNAHKGKALRELNRSKLVSPLIVIDPVEPSRNAAASLGEEKFNLFIRKAKEFLKHPSKEYFIKRDFSLGMITEKAKGNRLIMIKAVPPDGKEDVVGAKLLHAFEFIRDNMKEYGFTLHDAGWHWDRQHDAIFYLIVDKAPLASTYVRQGPPAGMEAHVAAFKQAHKKTFVETGKICAIIEREHTMPEGFIKRLLETEYVKLKIKKAKMA